MKALWLKYKIWFIVGGVVLGVGLLILIYFMILKAGKSQGVSSVLASIPNPSNDEPYDNDEKLNIRSYTDRLISDLGHWYNKYLNTDTDLYDALAVTSDRILKGCYIQYQIDTGNNLIADINGEQKWETAGAGVSKTFDRLKALIQE